MKYSAGCAFYFLLLLNPAAAQTDQATPLRQSRLTPETAGVPQPLTIRDAARDDRWLGLGVREVRWAPDGEDVYFRWNMNPAPEEDPETDPWFRVDRTGRMAKLLSPAEAKKIPTAGISWSRDGSRAAWASGGALFIYDAAEPSGEQIFMAFSTEQSCRRARITRDGRAVHFMLGENLFRYQVQNGTVNQVTRKFVTDPDQKTRAGKWLEAQQLDLFDLHRRRKDRRDSAGERNRRESPGAPQPIPVKKGMRVEEAQLSPDGRFVAFRVRTPDTSRPPTRYIDLVSESGYAEVREARPKVGEPQDDIRLGFLPMDPTADPDKLTVNWVQLPEAGDRSTLAHGPFWNVEGTRAVIQMISADHKDVWIAEVDPSSGQTRILAYDRDDAWLGGPPIQVNYFQPALLEWLPGNRFVFASERGGWSHLHLIEEDGTVRALTSGSWEVREATLSRDRTFWLIQAGRDHPSEDHLYTLPAAGGELTRLTQKPGRHGGILSPDGSHLAVVYGDAVRMPDLWLRETKSGAPGRRVTVSGADAYYRYPLVKPVIVSFPHSDGRLLWASLFKPERPNAERAAVIHVHGGGYRQFAHRGWSVYGYAMHLGAINYLVQQGYTVLDFDYRGSAGFGRDYRTDIYRSMGAKDIDGAVTAAEYLVNRHGIDSSRVGIYGISYGGFATLMALFRYPGVFAAGIANASVTDWAHYNHDWTLRILNSPSEDAEAYERSSPIYHAGGLADPLLIVHGLIDDNVQFQDAARLIQKLIELEKDFEVTIYPAERHTITTEASRYDYMKRLARFFDRNLLR